MTARPLEPPLRSLLRHRSPGLLAEANAAQQTLIQGLRLVTPLVGAGLFVWLGAGAVAVIDAATFCVAAACLAALRVTEAAPRGERNAGAAAAGEGAAAAAWPDETSSATGAAEGGSSAGFRYLAAEPVLRAITIPLSIVLLTLAPARRPGAVRPRLRDRPVRRNSDRGVAAGSARYRGGE